jgi:hypothetical protein
MTSKQRRFLVIKYWVGSPTSGALVGPVLVSTSDYYHLHFWDELDAATFRRGDYEVVKVYPIGLTFHEVERRFTQEFPSDGSMAWPLQDPIAPAWLWGGLGQHFGQPCLTA